MLRITTNRKTNDLFRDQENEILLNQHFIRLKKMTENGCYNIFGHFMLLYQIKLNKRTPLYLYVRRNVVNIHTPNILYRLSRSRLHKKL